jgi:hypothetical protein
MLAYPFILVYTTNFHIIPACIGRVYVTLLRRPEWSSIFTGHDIANLNKVDKKKISIQTLSRFDPNTVNSGHCSTHPPS